MTASLDTDPCFEIAARLAGAIALLSDYENIDASDDLQFVRRLLRDALRITNEYMDVVDDYTIEIRHASSSRTSCGKPECRHRGSEGCLAPARKAGVSATRLESGRSKSPML